MLRRRKTKACIDTEQFIDEYFKINGFPPTYREIQAKFNLQSVNTAYQRARFCRSKMITKPSHNDN
jgi:SOS-response transcriptional repressor LexA